MTLAGRLSPFKLRPFLSIRNLFTYKSVKGFPI